MAFLEYFQAVSTKAFNNNMDICSSKNCHMILYYKIATERNPSPRSIPWAIGFLAGFYL